MTSLFWFESYIATLLGSMGTVQASKLHSQGGVSLLCAHARAFGPAVKGVPRVGCRHHVNDPGGAGGGRRRGTTPGLPAGAPWAGA